MKVRRYFTKRYKVGLGLFSISLSLCTVVAAQTKPPLPSVFFNSFSYSLPVNLDFKDTAVVIGEVVKIAGEVSNWHRNAALNYHLGDSSALYTFLDRTIAVNIVLGDFQRAVDAISICRKIEKRAVFDAPYRLTQMAYSKACLQHSDDGSPRFKNIYANELIEQFSLINPLFRNEIVNRQKGITTPEMAPRYWKNLIRLLDYSLKNNSGKLSYSVAQHDVIPAYHAYTQLAKHQPLMDSVLHAISPSKITTLKRKVIMRDGIQVQAVIYRDSLINESLPAIISANPYSSGGPDAAKGFVFASNGYAYVYADCRGLGESEGQFAPFENDGQDLYDLIDWVSKQPWCNGKVAMSGGSYLGFSQWQVIKEQNKHPALKAINPMVSVGFGVDFPKENNIFYSFAIRWATYLSTRQPNHALYGDTKFWNKKYYEHYKLKLPFSKLDSVADFPNPFFQKWISHPDFDGYWQNILPSIEDYRKIDIPILSITGYYDGDQKGALHYYNQHQRYGSAPGKENHYLLIGPYDHGGAQWLPGNSQGGNEIESNAQIPLYKYVIWWFDWVLKGKEKPAFLKDKITYFEVGNNAWKGTGSFSNLTKDSLELFLTNNISPNRFRKDMYRLDRTYSRKDARIKYQHDIAAALDSVYLFSSKRSGDSIYMSSPYNLVFESLPIEKDIIISDKIISRIYASLNVPDADFEVIIKEVTEKGQEQHLATGRLRVRYRNGTVSQLAKPGEVMLLNINDVHINIKKVTRGSKIRLVFQSVNNPWNEKNFGFGGEVSKQGASETRMIEAVIHSGKKYKSKVVIPYNNE